VDEARKMQALLMPKMIETEVKPEMQYQEAGGMLSSTKPSNVL
jgi:hypothetical protein